MRRIGCLLVPDFVVAAAIQEEPILRGQAVVVLSEPSPSRIVAGANGLARARGVRPGMTEAEVLARPRAVICRQRVPEHERSAQHALLGVALAHSPRVELGGAGLLYLDLTGLRGLFGDEPEIGRRLRHGAAEAGLRAWIGIAGSRAAARFAAQMGKGVGIVPAGEEAAHLAPAPVTLLDLDAATRSLLERWGIRTLGELAALPAPDLFERLGREGLHLQSLARGEDLRPLEPHVPPERFEETVALDWGLETLEPVVAMLSDLAERLCARLVRRALHADAIEWRCRLADRNTHEGRLSLAFPTHEPAAIAALLRIALEARPPGGAVVAVTLRLLPTRAPQLQGLLDGEARQDLRLLGETLASLADVVGVDHLGIPIVRDSHRPDAVGLDPLALASVAHARAGERSGAGIDEERFTLALRRLRPPRPAAVSVSAGRPVHLRSDGLSGRVVACAGPWRTSGEWWGEGRWTLDEWDVELESGALCRIATDGRAWSLHGVYD
jgi:protein ImuB